MSQALSFNRLNYRICKPEDTAFPFGRGPSGRRQGCRPDIFGWGWLLTIPYPQNLSFSGSTRNPPPNPAPPEAGHSERAPPRLKRKTSTQARNYLKGPQPLVSVAGTGHSVKLLGMPRAQFSHRTSIPVHSLSPSQEQRPSTLDLGVPRLVLGHTAPKEEAIKALGLYLLSVYTIRGKIMGFSSPAWANQPPENRHHHSSLNAPGKPY